MSKTLKRIAQIRRLDPYYARECGKYENPLPSREYVLQILQGMGHPIGERELAEQLAITDDELYAFERRIRAMEREGQLMRNRKGAYILTERAA